MERKEYISLKKGLYQTGCQAKAISFKSRLLSNNWQGNWMRYSWMLHKKICENVNWKEKGYLNKQQNRIFQYHYQIKTENYYYIIIKKCHFTNDLKQKEYNRKLVIVDLLICAFVRANLQVFWHALIVFQKLLKFHHYFSGTLLCCELSMVISPYSYDGFVP